MELPATLLEEALEWSNDAVTITDAATSGESARIVYVNRAFESMTGYRRDEALGDSLDILQGPRTDPRVMERLGDALAEGDSFEGETWSYHKDGTPFLLFWTVRPVRDGQGRVTHYVAIQRDVTRARERARRRENLETVVALQREVSARGLDLQGVRQKIADAAMQISRADAAVVEEPDGGEMVYRAVAGIAEKALGLKLPIEGSLSGNCFRNRKVLRSDDTARDPRVHTEAAKQVGFISGLLFPLVHQQQCYGVLKVFSSRPCAFTDGDRQLLELASGILATALFNAASFEREVRRRGMLVDAIPILVSYIDRDRRYQEINAAYEDWFGLKAGDIRGKFVSEVLGDAAFEKIKPHLDAAFDGEQVSYEAEVPYRQGGSRTVLAQYQPHFAHDGRVHGVYAVVRDLTPVKQAEMDFLTGLWNRRKFEEQASYLIRKAARYGEPLSLILLDVDRFKQINDRFGHMAGDSVLKQVGEHLAKTVRGVDVVGRWGGEEFIILAPETSVEEAGQLSERIREEVRRLSFPRIDGITISVGIADLQEEERLGDLLERADQALYRAKREGRDRVVRAE